MHQPRWRKYKISPLGLKPPGFAVKVFLYHTYSTVQYNLGDGKPKTKKYHPCNNVYTLAVFKIPDRNVVVVCMVWLYTNQSTHHSPTTPKKSRARGTVSLLTR